MTGAENKNRKLVLTVIALKGCFGISVFKTSRVVLITIEDQAFTIHCFAGNQYLNSNRGQSFKNQAISQNEQISQNEGYPVGLECDQCGKQFRFRSLLETHYRVHTGDRPFSCPVCGRGFTQKNNMYAHCRYFNHFL